MSLYSLLRFYVIAFGFALSLLGCNVAKTAKETKNIAKDSRDRLARVEHNSTLLEMKRDLLDPKNTRVLEPVPFDMIVPGKRLAEALYVSEAADFSRLIISDLREDQDLQGRTPEEFDQQKRAKQAALSVVAGYLPTQTVASLVAQYVAGASVSRDNVLGMLVARAVFIHKVRLNQMILDRAVDNSAKIQEAMDLIHQLEFLARLPYFERVKLSINTYKNEAFNTTLTFPSKLVPEAWEALLSRIDTYDPRNKAGWAGGAPEQEAYIRSEIAKVSQQRAQVTRMIQGWQRQR